MMKTSRAFVIFLLLLSCNSDKKLFEEKTEDGIVIVKKGNFSGIDYLYVEKKINGKLAYKLYYDCTCGFNQIGLRKDYFDQRNQVTLWTAVTDTTNNFKFFGEEITHSILYQPYTFVAITNEEMRIINEAILKTNKDCCKDSSKPLNQIIGFVRTK